MLHLKNTKIIATIGPSSSHKTILTRMIKNGLDLIRFNMSHIYDYKILQSQISMVRKIAADLNKHIGIIMDLCGPKLRVMNNNKEVQITKNSRITMGFDESNDIRCSFKFDFSLIKRKSEIKMQDGQLIFKIISCTHDQIILKALNNGILKFNDGINLPDFETDIPILTEKRLDLTRKYVKRHYGVDSYHLVRPKMIVLHYTSVGTVANSIMMMKNDEVSPSRIKTRPFGKLNTGAHFLVSAKGDIYSLIPTTVIARHIVGFEHVSISIENVATEWSSLTPAQMDANTYLIKLLLTRNIVYHNV